MSDGNPDAAYRAGKNGWPRPEVVSSHNYSDDEHQAWKEGRVDRKGEQRL
ncbi:hypothetical protein [Natronorubrum sp. A-ect3]